MNRIGLAIFSMQLLFSVGVAVSQTSESVSEDPTGYINWKMPTLGGLQYWTDVRYVGGFKIQRNCTTNHHRLLDDHDMRIAWGDRAHCDLELDQRINEGIVKPDEGKIVIVMHGLSRTSNSMTTIADYLHQQGEYTVINFQYASSRETVETHAADLKLLIDGLGPGVTEINFVCHSLGNIVVRCYLGSGVITGTGRDLRIGRMIMLGPPNQGSKMARILKHSFLYHTIGGVSGAQLGVGWEELEPQLATPDFEFGIIAGGQPEDDDLDNFVLRGPDDFTVGLTETKLVGASDLLILPLFHSTMMNQPEVLEATLCFLQQGCFRSAAERHPIVRE